MCLCFCVCVHVCLLFGKGGREGMRGAFHGDLAHPGVGVDGKTHQEGLRSLLRFQSLLPDCLSTIMTGSGLKKPLTAL